MGFKSLLIACLAGLMISLGPGATAAELKIGFVNREKILTDAVPAKRAQQRLEKEFAPRDADLHKMEKQAQALQAKLDKEGMTMPEAERRNKERELANLQREFQRAQREFREDINMRRNEELAAILDRVNKVIQQIAESEKFDLILQDAVFASGKIDITDKVLKALEK